MKSRSTCFSWCALAAFRALVLFFVVACCVRCATATIRYEISLANPEQHLFRVTMTIPEVKDEVTVQMAAWNALYQVRDFASRVQQVLASAGGKALPVEKLDKQTWRIRGSGEITVRYATYWDEPGPFSSQLNEHHAFINPAMVLMYVTARRAESCQLLISDLPPAWKIEDGHSIDVYTGGNKPQTRTVLVEPNYDSLADNPIEVGAFQKFDLHGDLSNISIVVDGDHWSQDRMRSQLERICRYEVKLMGGAPYDHYTFLYHMGKAAEGGGGGMEHANGTAIYVPSDEYMAGVSAHEFFHLWNVKRIRPSSLEPIDYTKEQYTPSLWFAEGVTSTYGSYTMLRSGLWTKEQFYMDLSDHINDLESRSANKWQSAEQSSLDTWLEKYAWYNAPDFSVSYYTKGQILGVLLDIEIRDRTNNTKSLDDVMRYMNDEFAKKGKPYRDGEDIRASVEKVAGESFREFFGKYVSGTVAFPYDEAFRRAGLGFREAVTHRADPGFAADRGTGGNVIVRGVDSESPAWRAGLRVGDTIVQWNGGSAPRYIPGWARGRKPGDMLQLTISRDSAQQTISFPLGDNAQATRQLFEDPNASEKARRVREGLLKGETQKAGAASAGSLLGGQPTTDAAAALDAHP